MENLALMNGFQINFLCSSSRLYKHQNLSKENIHVEQLCFFFLTPMFISLLISSVVQQSVVKTHLKIVNIKIKRQATMG